MESTLTIPSRSHVFLATVLSNKCLLPFIIIVIVVQSGLIHNIHRINNPKYTIPVIQDLAISF